MRSRTVWREHRGSPPAGQPIRRLTPRTSG